MYVCMYIVDYYYAKPAMYSICHSCPDGIIVESVIQLSQLIASPAPVYIVRIFTRYILSLIPSTVHLILYSSHLNHYVSGHRFDSTARLAPF